MADTLGTSYKETARQWGAKYQKDGLISNEELRGAHMFAAHLDKSHLSTELQIIALHEGRKVDRECMTAIIDFIGKEKASEIIKPILMKYHKTK